MGLTEMHVAKAALTGNLQGENPFGKRNCDQCCNQRM